MRDRTYKWTLVALFGASFCLSAAAFARLAPAVILDLGVLLPRGVGGTPDRLPRAAAAFGLPMLALLVWALLHDAPVSRLGRAAARALRAPSPDPARFATFAPSYRLIVVSVVTIMLGLHGAVLAAAAEWSREPGRITGLILGAALVLMGNVMPRLRPNVVAGIRTSRTLNDPAAWARVHRAFGAAWVVAGLATAAVALIAPRWALVTWVVALLVPVFTGLFTRRERAQLGGRVAT